MKVMPVAMLPSKLSAVRVNNLDCGGEETLLVTAELIVIVAEEKLNFSLFFRTFCSSFGAAGISSSACFSSSSLAALAFSWLSTKSLKDSRSLFPLYWSVWKKKERKKDGQIELFGVRLGHWQRAETLRSAVPSGRCGRRAAWDTLARRSRSRLHSAACSPPASLTNTHFNKKKGLGKHRA